MANREHPAAVGHNIDELRNSLNLSLQYIGKRLVDLEITPNAGADGADGATGADGVSHYLTNAAHVVPANFDGTGYDTAFTGAGGTHKVFDGTADKTTTAVHSITSSATKNGLTISVGEDTGIYSLSGASWTTDTETFTLRAVYNSVNYDQEYTIAKAKQGNDGGCALDTLTPFVAISTGSGTRVAGLRVNNNGTIEKRANGAYSVKETWKGACANSEYECRLEKTSGTNPSGPALDTWHVCSTTRTWEKQSAGPLIVFDGVLRIRRTSDNKVLKTVAVHLETESDV